jgi:hypothetical protein
MKFSLLLLLCFPIRDVVSHKSFSNILAEKFVYQAYFVKIASDFPDPIITMSINDTIQSANKTSERVFLHN